MRIRSNTAYRFRLTAGLLLVGGGVAATGCEEDAAETEPPDPDGIIWVSPGGGGAGAEGPGGAGGGGAPVGCAVVTDCEDDDACTTNACVADQCEFTPIDPDDFDVCTTDTCDPAAGPVHTAVDAADGDLCTLDLCDPVAGISNPAEDVRFLETFADNTQGWTLGAEWEIGPAAGTGGPGADPAQDVTQAGDNGVAGVVLGGNASTAVHGFEYLTSPVFDGSLTQGSLVLELWRWIHSDEAPYMHNTIEVFDGAQWVVVWSSTLTLADGPPTGDGWILMSYDISAYANLAMQVRFGFDVATAGAFSVSSWNIDDVRVVQTMTTPDADPCTTDTCDPAAGPVYTAIAVDDGNVCTSDTCDPERGVQHTPTGVDDGNACTTDTCDPVTGPIFTPVDPDDGNVCTNDSCDAVLGVINAPITCDDGNACTPNSCDPVLGCQFGPAVPQPHDKCTTGGPLIAGCTDACINAICAATPSCCTTGWTAACTAQVYSVCGSLACPAGTCPHSPCSAGPGSTPFVSGCDSPPVSPSCVAQICVVDPFCCSTDWDLLCTTRVVSTCGLSCQ